MDTNALRDTWLMFEREHKCSVDRMVCDPVLRAEFLASAKLVTGSDNENEILWGLFSLRKRKALKAS